MWLPPTPGLCAVQFSNCCIILIFFLRPKGIESLPPLPNVSATGKTDLPLVESVPKGANDRGTNHFLPHKNTEIRRLLAIHKQAQLEFGPSKIPSKAQNNTHFFSDKTSNFADVKLPNVVFKGDIANQKIRKKPGEASLPPLLQPSDAKRNSRLRYVHYYVTINNNNTVVSAMYVAMFSLLNIAVKLEEDMHLVQ